MKPNFVPRPYQTPATRFILENRRCAVWGFLGCGKTGATLQALNLLNDVEGGPALVLAPPKVAASTWGDEVSRWAEFEHLRVRTIVGSPTQRAGVLSRADGDIYTCSHENLPWLMERLKNDWPFKTVVWDEATKLRGFRGSEQQKKNGEKYFRMSGAMRLRELARIVHSKVDRFIELTAKPAPNGVKNLWPQLWFLDKGKRLGRTYDAFSQRWFHVGYDGFSLVPYPHAEGEIQERIKDLCMAIDEKDYFDLTKPIVTNVYVDLPKKVRESYNELERKFYTKVKNREIEAVSAGSKTGKLLQLAAGAVYVDHEDESDTRPKEYVTVHDEKIEALRGIIEETNGAPLIVAYNFKSDLDRLKKAFPNGVHLQTKKEEEDFKKGKIDLLFLHPASAGHGIDGFQKACYMLAFFSRDWNLDNYDQLVGRINPIRQLSAGFTRAVHIWHIIARNTMDEEVDERHATKRAVQDILLAATKRKL